MVSTICTDTSISNTGLSGRGFDHFDTTITAASRFGRGAGHTGGASQSGGRGPFGSDVRPGQPVGMAGSQPSQQPGVVSLVRHNRIGAASHSYRRLWVG